MPKIERPEKVCHFQRIEEIKSLPLLKVTEYEIKCELTARKSSWIELFWIHLSSTDFLNCDPEICPIYQTYSILSDRSGK